MLLKKNKSQTDQIELLKERINELEQAVAHEQADEIKVDQLKQLNDELEQKLTEQSQIELSLKLTIKDLEQQNEANLKYKEDNEHVKFILTFFRLNILKLFIIKI